MINATNGGTHGRAYRGEARKWGFEAGCGKGFVAFSTTR